MQSWLAKKLISFVMGRTRAGDIRPTLLLDAPDVQLTFPGRNSWSGVFRGKQEVERWLRRLAAVGLQTFPDEVVAKGMPWNTTICIRGHDHLDAPDGDAGVREPVRDLGPALVGPPQGVRGLRGHASPARARRLSGRAAAGAGRRLIESGCARVGGRRSVAPSRARRCAVAAGGRRQ